MNRLLLRITVWSLAGVIVLAMSREFLPMDSFTGLSADTITLLLALFGVAIAIATLIMHNTARLDADRRETQQRFDTAMEAFRAEMRNLGQRQSYVEGRIDGHSAAGGD